MDTPPSGKGKGYKLAVNEFILSEFADKKIDNAWDKKHWRQQKDEAGPSERQAQLIVIALKRFQLHSGITNVNQARKPQFIRFMQNGRLKQNPPL